MARNDLSDFSLLGSIGRRELVALLGGAAVVWPIVARGQQSGRAPRIGVLMGVAEADPEARPRAAAFQKRLQELGWTEGRIQIDYRWVGENAERLRAGVAEVVALAPSLIVADTTAALSAVKPAAGNIPIVFLRVSDPVNSGFVDSLARPSGNITGIANFEYAIGSKWLELLKQVAPRVAHVTMLSYPGMIVHEGLRRAIEAAAPSFAVTARAVPVRDTAEIERAILAAADEPRSGLIVLPHLVIETNRGLIIDMAARYRLPAIYPLRHYTSAGGLIAYGPEPMEIYRQAAAMVDRILKGARPADLPVQQPTNFELSINLKTANALGLTPPETVLALADEVIE